MMIGIMSNRMLTCCLMMSFLVISITIARPQNAAVAENQEPDFDEYQSNLSDLPKNYYPASSVQDLNALLDKNQIYFPQQFKQNIWDNYYRSPEMKRQVRYRQCYFNPISCFKK